MQISECAKKSPELIQLLELHTQFASLASYGQVNRNLVYGKLIANTSEIETEYCAKTRYKEEET